jgi:plasmid stabilization system protein ParE
VDSVELPTAGWTDFFNVFEALARTPGMGHRREDLTQYSILFWPVGAYLIIYSSEHRQLTTL